VHTISYKKTLFLGLMIFAKTITFECKIAWVFMHPILLNLCML